MAEFIGDQGFLETTADDTRRPANHKAQWTETALRELEMLVMRKETWVGKWDEIIKLLEVEPRQSAPQEYINLQKDRFSPEVIESRWKDEDIAKWRALRDHNRDTWEEITAFINSNHRAPISQSMTHSDVITAQPLYPGAVQSFGSARNSQQERESATHAPAWGLLS